MKVRHSVFIAMGKGGGGGGSGLSQPSALEQPGLEDGLEPRLVKLRSFSAAFSLGTVNLFPRAKPALAPQPRAA